MSQNRMGIARPIFLVGSPRSGMTLLQWGLSQHPNIFPVLHGKWIGELAAKLPAIYSTMRAAKSESADPAVTPMAFLEHFGNAAHNLLMRGCNTHEKGVNRDAGVAGAWI